MNRFSRFGSLVLFGVLVAGCYTLQPVRGATPPLGSQVAFDVNDAGRVALGGQIGPEVGQIEGRLVNRESTEYVVAVSAVHMLRGGQQVWRGETVRLRPEFLGNMYERRFSKGRTALVGAALIGGVAALVAGRSLLGIGQEDNPTPIDTGQARFFPNGRPHSPLPLRGAGLRLNFRGVIP